MFDPTTIKKDFPILSREVEGNKLVYLDNAATSQKPTQVIDALVDYYKNHNANVHRGVHTLSEEATDMYEEARAKVAEFIGAVHFEEIIFTKGTTESLNRVAFEWGFENLSEGDEMVIMEADHHSNIIPWQIVAERTGAKLHVLEVIKEGEHLGEFDMPSFKNLLKSREGKIKFIAVSHVSNVLGTVFPVKEICKLAKEAGAIVSVDGAQGIPHIPVDVQSLGCDFYSFSGHKMLGPTGIGVLWGKKELLETMPPYEYGGGMIKEVTKKTATYADIPERFEAGTPNVAGAIGLAAAVDYLTDLGMENVLKHEQELMKYAMDKLSKVEGLHILRPKDNEKRCGVVSFYFNDMHPHDIATILNTEGIAVRSGQHCTMPLHVAFNVSATVRASFSIYNTKEDIDALVAGLEKAKELLQ